MTWFSKPLARSTIALSILILLVGLLAWALMQTVVAIPLSRHDDIVALARQLAWVKSGTEREATLTTGQHDSMAELLTLSAFWAGPSRTEIAAAMQDVLRSAAQESGGSIVSSSLVENNRPNVLSIRARVSGTLQTLHHVLVAIELARPRLFVDSLMVTAPSGGSTATHQQELSFELSTSGYLSVSGVAKR